MRLFDVSTFLLLLRAMAREKYPSGSLQPGLPGAKLEELSK